ncbi:MAG: hypothetical protein V2J26_04830 [Pacificimonas sp.]|jgi:hypothetical protein|nr:hypothetical protein [Pacificimonas sp.]
MKTFAIAAATAALMAVPAAADPDETETRAQKIAEMRDNSPVMDSRGHTVYSMEAITPAGYYGADSNAAMKMNDIKTTDYPVCGPDQTDRCVQPGAR